MNKNTINDEELGAVSGGVAGWSGSRGNYVNCGSHIVYTVYHGEKLSSIAPRFGVTVEEIEEWNGLKAHGILKDGQKLTIYPRAML
ncbi:MAG: LysM peptidoglycan-binding domain-containing protein [Oscillospiraceae bacterium]|jgi:hypothetical protein|nr:LysM peptidoglycan-binding domain-containing protein [Oscillospiraceae bacterium]MBQ2145829.1 LysM peptidoglycan-binding domain-containing protein [Oscillospiraceae bacterium]MBQ5490196.1 LysM peptidoglycan-binding domain-containing protein [Oscillospiraceae bacterium]